MRPEASDASYLADMLEYALRAVEFSTGLSAEEYMRDERSRRAVERVIELIGEAARNVSEPFRTSNPQIPWARIIGQRNVLAHDYGEVDDLLIWNLVQQHIPILIADLRRLV